MSDLQIVIPGDPVPQGRGRVGRWKAKDGREGVTVRDPSKSRDWKGRAQYLMVQALGSSPFEVPFAPAGTPVRLTVVAHYTCPKGDHRKREPRPARWHIKRGDLDNIVKAVKDAANGVLWVDDAQVAAITAEKWIAEQGEPGRVEVWVEPINEEGGFY